MRPLSEQIVEAILDVAKGGWLQYMDLDDERQARVTWLDNGIVRLEHQETGHVAEFEITVTAKQLSPHEPEPESIEFRLGTWADVRPGDRVRLGQSEAEVIEVMPLKWLGSGAREIKVTLDSRPEPYAMRPSGQVEIGRLPQVWLLTEGLGGR